MSEPRTFLLFSLGPVQEFIAAARKTKDLFAGSLLLSHLSAKAIETILGLGSYKNVKMMFPFVELAGEKLRTHETLSSIPNRFLVDVSECSLDDAHDYAEKAKEAVQTEFGSIASLAKGKIEGIARINEHDPVWQSLWNEQIPKFLECYWVVHQSDEAYGKHYLVTEQLSGKRKLLRDFDELTFHPNGKGQPFVKCTIILNHSAVHTQKESNNRRKMREFWDHLVSEAAGSFRRGERLSAVALSKRFFVDYLKQSLPTASDEFPSTTTIAAGAFNQALLNACRADGDFKATIGEYARQVQALLGVLRFPKEIANLPALEKNADEDEKKYLGLDADWLYEDMYDAEYIVEEFNVDAAKNNAVQSALSKAHDAQSHLMGKIRQVNQRHEKPIIPKVSKYYAVLFFDGDHMGKWLSGSIGEVTALDSDTKVRFVIDKEPHRKISNSLRQFSTPPANEQNVYQIVETQHLGKIIYSGGDDVVAFVSLSDCLEVALRIRNAFTHAMGYKEASGSAGIAIAHHQMNLQQVLQEARNAEHYAKETLHRNTFAFALLKRSGEHFITGAKWFFNGLSAIAVMNSFADLIRDETVSSKFVHDLEEERISLEVFEQTGVGDTAAVIGEIKRLFNRHTVKGEKHQEQQAKAQGFRDEELTPLYQAVVEEAKKTDRTASYSALHQLVDLLEVAQFIGQGGER